MKMLPFLAPLAFAAAAAAEPPAPAAAPAAGTVAARLRVDQNQTVCRSVRETGSLLAHRRICQTRQEWEDQYRLNRQSLEHNQTVVTGGSPGD